MISAGSLGKTAHVNHQPSSHGKNQLTRSIKQAVAACLLGALALPGIAMAQNTEQQEPNETVKATHGAWQVVCSTSQPDVCVVRQFGELAEGNRVLEVRVRKLDGVTTQDGQELPAVIRITTPLGSLLRNGLTVKVDASEAVTGAYEVCLPRGCIVEDPMSQEFLARFKAGAVANMTFGVVQQEQEISVDISLQGFTAAFNSL